VKSLFGQSNSSTVAKEFTTIDHDADGNYPSSICEVNEDENEQEKGDPS